MNENSIPENVSKIISKLGNGNYIFRGTTKACSEEGEREINSSLYRQLEESQNPHPEYTLSTTEKEIVNKAKKYFPDKTSNIEILTELQHYGNPTNLIDFSTNIYVGLFFACNGDFTEDGELISINIGDMKKGREINYDEKDGGLISSKTDYIEHEEDQIVSSPKDEIFYIHPATTQASQRRVIAQSSIFVYPKCGYIDKDMLTIDTIPKDSKELILDHLDKMIGITSSTIYNDLIGFIENRKNREKYFAELTKSDIARKAKEFEKSIGHCDKALRLNPRGIEAYNSRGLTKCQVAEGKDTNKDLSGGIKDFDKAIELDPDYTNAYINRGTAKYIMSKHEEAIKDYNRAIELEPNTAKIYVNRGIAKSEMGNNEEAIKDFDEAIGLDPNYAASYVSRGVAKSKLGTHEEATVDWKKAIELNPNYKTTLRPLIEAAEEEIRKAGASKT